MRALLSTYGSRGDVEAMVGLAVQLAALGAAARVCVPVATRVMPTGGWR
jgi:vancomycin aglycone glucosyltransferase